MVDDLVTTIFSNQYHVIFNVQYVRFKSKLQAHMYFSSAI